MIYEDMLFVGGYGDSKRYSIDEIIDVYYVPEPIESPSLVYGNKPVNSIRNQHTYHKQRLSAGDTIYYVMVYDGLQGDIVDALINGYKREER